MGQRSQALPALIGRGKRFPDMVEVHRERHPQVPLQGLTAQAARGAEAHIGTQVSPTSDKCSTRSCSTLRLRSLMLQTWRLHSHVRRDVDYRAGALIRPCAISSGGAANLEKGTCYSTNSFINPGLLTLHSITVHSNFVLNTVQNANAKTEVKGEGKLSSPLSPTRRHAEPAHKPQLIIRGQCNHLSRCLKDKRNSELPTISALHLGERCDALFLSTEAQAEHFQHNSTKTPACFSPGAVLQRGSGLPESGCDVRGGKERNWSVRTVLGRKSITELARGHCLSQEATTERDNTDSCRAEGKGLEAFF